MAFNPMELMKLKGRLDLFSQQHPRFPAFLKDIGDHAIEPGHIIEIKAVTPDGREYLSNIRLTQDDVETVQIARGYK